MFNAADNIIGCHHLVDHLLQLVAVRAARAEYLDLKFVRLLNFNRLTSIFLILPQQGQTIIVLSTRRYVVLGLEVL